MMVKEGIGYLKIKKSQNPYYGETMLECGEVEEVLK
jgi:hypothetical protein